MKVGPMGATGTNRPGFTVAVGKNAERIDAGPESANRVSASKSTIQNVRIDGRMQWLLHHG